MKNIWLELAEERNCGKKVSDWLAIVINKEGEELAYALYTIIDCVFDIFRHEIKFPLFDEDDAKQECVLEMLRVIDRGIIFQPGMDDHFAYMFYIVKNKLFRLSNLDTGFVLGKKTYDKAIEDFYKKLKKDGKI
jgi:hypothetical protein